MFEYDRLALNVAEQICKPQQQQPPIGPRRKASGSPLPPTAVGKKNSAPLPTNSGLNDYCQYIRPQQKQQQHDQLFSSKSVDGVGEENTRRLSGGSNSYGDCSTFDCGASSGYGSPGVGGTPLASPAPNSAYFVNQLQRMLDNEAGEQPKDRQIASQKMGEHYEQDSYESFFGTAKFSSALDTTSSDLLEMMLTSGYESFNTNSDNGSVASGRQSTALTPNASSTTTTGAGPMVATEDGFSAAEIAQFAQLLCSPKKAPPQRYQCHICYQQGHYISDCPMRFNSPYEELTPYQGRKKCYGEFQCQLCKRKWTSQNSVANEAQSCIKCHVPVFPHKQLPVDKAIALGLVKSHRVVPAKITPIGHGRPPVPAGRLGN